jgi:hypothetical protein
MAVGSLLVLSFMSYTNALRGSSEVNELKNLTDHVAAKATELLALNLPQNSTVEDVIQTPTSIGNRQYWIRLRNDSVKAWVEGGFGDTPTEESDLRVFIPAGASASGHYAGGYGSAVLRCYWVENALRIELKDSREGA